MTEPLQVLLVEDSPDDALLLEHYLNEAGFRISMQRVESNSQLQLILDNSTFDIVIADYVLPGFSGLDALEIVKQHKLDIPFIIVSGKVGEEAAVEAMRAGVHDYITKDNLARLAPAVRRELNDASMRREHRATQLALERAREEVERQRRRDLEIKLLGKLVSGVAHEVRNPLNAITALLEAVFQEVGEPDLVKPYRTHIEAQVVRINHLMLDLLELGKPTDDTTFVGVDLAQLCESTASHWNNAPLAGTSHVQYRYCGSDPALVVRGDAARLRQVLLNLIENASEHSASGSSVSLLLDSAGHDARIRIIDSGTGINPDYLDLIFDPFFTTRKAGTGLGLGIARHIVEAHGGTLHITNNNGTPGVTAEIVLPVPPAPAPAP
jgi:signal transduction histidine kinase